MLEKLIVVLNKITVSFTKLLDQDPHFCIDCGSEPMLKERNLPRNEDSWDGNICSESVTV